MKNSHSALEQKIQDLELQLAQQSEELALYQELARELPFCIEVFDKQGKLLGCNKNDGTPAVSLDQHYEKALNGEKQVYEFT
ncbi:MAG: hypothetical protein R6U66_01690, partial [Bacteroidales bacterium]